MSCIWVSAISETASSSLPLFRRWHCSRYSSVEERKRYYAENVGLDNRNHTKPQTLVP
jgi:hypothetical protein